MLSLLTISPTTIKRNLSVLFPSHLNSNESTIFLLEAGKSDTNLYFLCIQRNMQYHPLLQWSPIVFSRSTVKVYESDMLAAYTNVSLPPSLAGDDSLSSK
jgi:hypothetical protein